jgi:hypothetical protein
MNFMLDTKHRRSVASRDPCAMLCEASSMPSVSRITGVSISTVSKLLIDAGVAYAAFHDATVRGIAANQVLFGLADHFIDRPEGAHHPQRIGTK